MSVLGELWCYSLKQAHWILIFVLLGSVLCVASIPAVDDPDTEVDESEFQVNLATPSALGIKLVHPVANSADLPKLASCQQDLRSHSSRHEFMPVPKQSRSHSSQTLLCTFLI